MNIYEIQAHLWVNVNKFQNENMKSSHCPKYERKKGRIFQIFRSYFGQWDDSIFSSEISWPLEKLECFKSNNYENSLPKLRTTLK